MVMQESGYAQTGAIRLHSGRATLSASDGRATWRGAAELSGGCHVDRIWEVCGGAPPPGFSTGLTGKGRAVAWTVLEDPSTPSGHALAEVSADTTDYRFPIAIYDDQS